MTLPNFLVIGTGRSGTTSLHHYLRQHPEIYLPHAKAPSYFYCLDAARSDDPYLHLVSRNYFVGDLERYEALFAGVGSERAIGEVSPVYLATTRAAPRIAELIPTAKLLAVVRNPVDRAWARFLARRRDGLERRQSFADIVREETDNGLLRDDAHGTYIASGFVFHFLESYLERFRRESLFIRLFEDLKSDTEGLLAEAFEFLDVDSAFQPDLERHYNPSRGVVRQPVLRSIWSNTGLLRARLRPFLPRAIRDAAFAALPMDDIEQQIDPEIRSHLVELFRDDILRLQDWLDRDLSTWLR